MWKIVILCAIGSALAAPNLLEYGKDVMSDVIKCDEDIAVKSAQLMGLDKGKGKSDPSCATTDKPTDAPKADATTACDKATTAAAKAETTTPTPKADSTTPAADCTTPKTADKTKSPPPHPLSKTVGAFMDKMVDNFGDFFGI